MLILNNYYFKLLWTDLKKTLTKEYFISFRFLFIYVFIIFNFKFY